MAKFAPRRWLGAEGQPECLARAQALGRRIFGGQNTLDYFRSCAVAPRGEFTAAMGLIFRTFQDVAADTHQCAKRILDDQAPGSNSRLSFLPLDAEVLVIAATVNAVGTPCGLKPQVIPDT